MWLQCGGSGVYKIDTIKLVIAGNSIGVDLRGASASARERAARGDAASRAPHTTQRTLSPASVAHARDAPPAPFRQAPRSRRPSRGQ